MSRLGVAFIPVLLASLAVPALAADSSTVADDTTVTIDSVRATGNGSVVVGGVYSCAYRTTVSLEAGYLGHLDPADGSAVSSGLPCGPWPREWSVEVPLDDLVIPGRPGTAEMRMTDEQGEVLAYVSAGRSVEWADAKTDWESYIVKADAAGAAATIAVALKCVVGADYWVRLAVLEAEGPKGATRTPLTRCETGTAQTTVAVPGDGVSHTHGADVAVTMRLETGEGAVLNERSIATRFGY